MGTCAIPSEHLDNPEGGGTAEEYETGEGPEHDNAESQLSDAQKSAYKDEWQVHSGAIEDAAKESGLPVYIERGKFSAKQYLTEAIDLGRTDAGMQKMGNALHAIEDYYSHSNFIEVAIWYLHKNNEVNTAEYSLVRTEVGNWADSLGGTDQENVPKIITGSYAPGANKKVSELELLCTEVEHGALTKAFVIGALRKTGVTAEEFLKKAVAAGWELGSKGGKYAGMALGGVSLGVPLATLGGVVGGLTGAISGAVEGVQEHSGFSSSLGHGVKGFATGLVQGGWEGIKTGAQTAVNAGGAVGGAVGGTTGALLAGLVGLTLEAAVGLVGTSLALGLFPVIATLMTAALAGIRAAIKAGVLERRVKQHTRKAAEEAKDAKLGPSHAEIAKDAPDHKLFAVAIALAEHVDSDIGRAMARAWAEKENPPSADAIASVTKLVDKYVSHPTTNRWWHDIVLDGVKKQGQKK